MNKTTSLFTTLTFSFVVSDRNKDNPLMKSLSGFFASISNLFKSLSSISLAKKAGQLAIGIDSIKIEALGNRHCVIIVAEGAKSLKNHSLLQAKDIQSFENLFKKEDLVKSSGKNNVKYVGILSKTFKKTIQVDLNKLKGFIENH